MLTYEKWNHIIIACFAVLAIYFLNELKNTFVDYKSYRQNEMLINSGTINPIFYKEDISSGDSLECLINSSDLVEIISKECIDSGVTLKKLPHSESYDFLGFSLLESTIHLTGKYKDIVILLNKLESNTNIGSVVSTGFFIDKRNKRKSPVLNASIKIINACKSKT